MKYYCMESKCCWENAYSGGYTFVVRREFNLIEYIIHTIMGHDTYYEVSKEGNVNGN